MTDELTLVTGWWPQKHDLVRTGDVYVRLFQELITNIDGVVPAVVYVDPSIEVRVRAMVDKHKHPDRVVVRPLPFEQLRFAQDRKRFEDLQPATNSFSLRDTIEYAIIGWSKPWTVLAAAAEDPFGSSHFGWIDFGLAHLADLYDVDWVEIATESTRTKRVRICERMATDAKEVEDPWYFYSANSARVCGGMFSGPKSTLADFAALFESEVERMASTGSYTLEEHVMSAATALQPHLFEKWYADYWGILRNARLIRRDVELVISNLKHCRDSALWHNACDITSLLLDSAEEYLHLSPEQCFHVLDCGLAAAVHADEDLARHLANTTLSLHHYSRVGRGMMRGTWRRSILESLKAMDLDFGQRPWTWEEFSAQPDFRAWFSCF